MIKKLVSGGNSGSDQAGLYAAKAFNIPTGGYAPKNWLTSNGPQKDLLQSFGLQEYEGGYKARTYKNVEVSDATICCSINFQSAGTVCTIKAIKYYNKPFLLSDLAFPFNLKEAIDWIINNNIQILNVAGNRNTDLYHPIDKDLVYVNLQGKYSSTPTSTIFDLTLERIKRILVHFYIISSRSP
jgi:hypothetical protein